MSVTKQVAEDLVSGAAERDGKGNFIHQQYATKEALQEVSDSIQLSEANIARDGVKLYSIASDKKVNFELDLSALIPTFEGWGGYQASGTALTRTTAVSTLTSDMAKGSSTGATPDYTASGTPITIPASTTGTQTYCMYVKSAYDSHVLHLTALLINTSGNITNISVSYYKNGEWHDDYLKLSGSALVDNYFKSGSNIKEYTLYAPEGDTVSNLNLIEIKITFGTPTTAKTITQLSIMSNPLYNANLVAVIDGCTYNQLLVNFRRQAQKDASKLFDTEITYTTSSGETGSFYVQEG